MFERSDIPVGERRRHRRRVMPMAWLIAAALALQCAPGFAATLWNVEKLVKNNITLETGKPVALPEGAGLTSVRIEYLRALFEAYRRIGDVSKANAELALVVDRAPNAKAYFGQRLIVVTTGMLDIIGTDPNMIAAVLGHEFAHLSLRHAVERVMNLPAIVYGGVAVANSVSQRTQDNTAAARAGVMAIGLMAASFSRRQEAEADKVGVEFMSRAKYDPDGVLRLLDKFVQLAGAKETGYLDSHPGFAERLANAAPTVKNQQYDMVAATLAGQKRWKPLAALADQWVATNPASAGAWYYRGLALRGMRRPGALAAFEKSAAYDPNFTNGRLELCVELYRQKRERDSVICSEAIPTGDLHDEYEARTFQHPVIAAGLTSGPTIGTTSAQLLQDVAALRGKPPAPATTVTPIPVNVAAQPAPPQSPPAR